MNTPDERLLDTEAYDDDSETVEGLKARVERLRAEEARARVIAKPVPPPAPPGRKRR